MDLLTRSFQSTHRETFHSNMSPGEISDSDDDEDMQYRLTREYSLLGLSAKHAATISTIHVTSLHAAILISSNEIFHISGEGSQSVCNWYSAVVCCVSIGRLLSLPLRSYLLPATTISSVAQVGIMMFVTLCGEGLFVYFLECSLHSETEFILQIAFSRVLMGFGANGIEVAVGFIERFAASSSTLKTMRALFRSAERVHQWWAPLCFGIVFSWLPIPTPNLLCGTSIADLFNFYTLPSWVVVISAFMWLLIAGCTLQCSYIPSMFLRANNEAWRIPLSPANPLHPLHSPAATALSEALAQSPARVTSRSLHQMNRPAATCTIALSIHTVIVFSVHLIFSGIIWNLFAIGSVRARLISGQHEIWRAFVPVALGGFCGWLFPVDLFTVKMRRYRVPIVSNEDSCGILLGLSLLLLSSILLYFTSPTRAIVTFFLGTICFGFGISWFQKASDNLYVKQVVRAHRDSSYEQLQLIKQMSVTKEVAETTGSFLACSLLRVTGLGITSDSSIPACEFTFHSFKIRDGCSLSLYADSLLLSFVSLLVVILLIAIPYTYYLCDIDGRILTVHEEREDIL